jgi:hypothetical protein
VWWLFGRGQRDHVVSRRSNDCVFTKEYSRCEATPTASNVAVGAVEAADSISVCESLSTHCVMGSSRYNILILFVLFCVVRGVTLHSWSWRQDLCEASSWSCWGGRLGRGQTTCSHKDGSKSVQIHDKGAEQIAILLLFWIREC